LDLWRYSWLKNPKDLLKPRENLRKKTDMV
jgi:hypothetical protein